MIDPVRRATIWSTPTTSIFVIVGAMNWVTGIRLLFVGVECDGLGGSSDCWIGDGMEGRSLLVFDKEIVTLGVSGRFVALTSFLGKPGKDAADILAFLKPSVVLGLSNTEFVPN